MSRRRRTPPALALERRTPIGRDGLPALASASLDELIDVLARALSDDYRRRVRRG